MTKMSARVRVRKQKYTKSDAKEPEGYMSFFSVLMSAPSPSRPSQKCLTSFTGTTALKNSFYV